MKFAMYLATAACLGTLSRSIERHTQFREYVCPERRSEQGSLQLVTTKSKHRLKPSPSSSFIFRSLMVVKGCQPLDPCFLVAVFMVEQQQFVGFFEFLNLGSTLENATTGGVRVPNKKKIDLLRLLRMGVRAGAKIARSNSISDNF
jgi:hypothetical protein